MILGTCNFSKPYNNSYLGKDNSFKVMNYFYENGGKIIDTAPNYDQAEIYIKEFGWKGDIITKAWNNEDIKKSFESFNINKIFCIMNRDVSNDNLRYFLLSLKKENRLEEIGASIYFPHEIRQYYNSFHLPNDKMFDEYLEILQLYANVYIRSNFNLFNGRNKEELKKRIKYLKSFERKDLNHRIDFVVGVSNLEQLKENMELFL